MTGEDEDGKPSRKKVTQTGEELKALHKVFSEADIFCAQESHIQEKDVENISKKLFNMDWEHTYTTATDKFAGVSIAWKWWIPKPINLLIDLWKEFSNHIARPPVGKFRYEHISLLIGRIMVLVFQLEELDVIIANLYVNTSSRTDEQRYHQITTATCIIEDTARLWSNRMPKDRKVCVVLVGDFNTHSNAMRCISKSPPEVLPLISHKSNTKCPENAMDYIDTDSGSGNFVHARKWLDIPSPLYLTHRTFEKGVLKRSSGIDHIYVMSKQVGNFCPYVPKKIVFWHGQPRSTPRSGHDMMAITLKNVWTSAVNRNAKGSNAPYKRLPYWLFEDVIFMDMIRERAIIVKRRMEKPRAPIDTLFHQFYGQWIPEKAKKFIEEKKKRLIRKSTSIRDPSNLKQQQQLDEINEQWDNLTHPKPNLFTQNFDSYNDSGIAGVRTVDGMVLTNPEAITDHIYNIFTSKYSKRPFDPGRKKAITESLKYAPTKISTCESSLLDIPITSKDILETITNMNPDAAPASDGISLALYLHPSTKDIMAEILAMVMNYAMNNGRLPEILIRAIIRLVQKDGRDNTNILIGKRPIMLMAIPTRIMAKVTSVKLAQYILSWVRENQKAYIKGRRIEFNTAILTTILQKCVDGADMQEYLKDLIVLEVDFEAAFDSVDHEFIRSLLRCIGVGKKMITIIMLILGKLNVTIIVNSGQTKSFRIQRGVPQGCALSGDIFILVLECLFNLVSLFPEKFGNGVSLIPNGRKILDMEYADDVNAFATKNAHVVSWLEALDQFKFPSGVTPNLTKTRANLIGRNYWGDPIAEVYGENCKSQLEMELQNRIPVVIANDIKLVGVTLSIRTFKGIGPPTDVGKVSITKPTWASRLKSFIPYARYQKVALARKPILSKINPINEAMARLWYIVPTCPPTPENFKTVAGLVDLMLTGNTTPLVKRTVSSQPVGKPGGLGTPHISNRILSLNSMWVRLYALEELPTCLQEYMRSIIQKMNGNTQISRGDPVLQIEELCPKVTFPARDFDPGKETCPTPTVTLQKLLQNEYQPMVNAITTYAFYKNKGVVSDPTLSTANVYTSLMKQNDTAPLSDQIPIGQTKWNQKVPTISNENWTAVWTLTKHLKKAKQLQLHHGLYSIITARHIVPIVAAGKDKLYKPCKYCTLKDWSATHTTFECNRVTRIWQTLWSSEKKTNPITLVDILTVDGYNIKDKKPFVLKLTRLQLKMLIYMRELITWTERHKNTEDPLSNPQVIQNEDVFVKEMLSNIDGKLAYFKKLGIG